MLRATPVIRPETAVSTGYVVVVAVVLATFVLITLDNDATTDDDDDDDDVLMVNKDNTFANDLDVAKLLRLKNPPLVKLDTTNSACAHACFAFTETTSSGTNDACKELARVSSREGEGSWTPAALTKAWQSCTRNASRAVSNC